MDCARAVVPVLLDASGAVRSRGPKALAAHVSGQLKRCAPLLVKYLETLDDQIDVIYTVQEVCEDDQVLAKVFAQLLSVLYQIDVVTEAAVLQWAEESKAAEDKSFLKRAAPFLQWLQTADEESDEEGS